MRRLLNAHPEITVVGEAKNGVEALQQCAALQPAVVFLDIEMPGLDGLGVARVLNGPRIIFVTAYDAFAVKAFEEAAVDYLVKPVTPERLAKAVSRLHVPQRLPLEQLAPPKRFAVKCGAEYHLVDAHDVVCIVSDDHYATLKLSKRELLCDESLTSLERRLGARFMRVHRTAIANLDAAVRFEREGARKYVLVMRDGQRLVISRERVNDVRTALGLLE